MVRAELERIDRKERKSAAGRKPTDRVVMFKMLVLRNLYRLSDEALEYPVSDRLTCMRFPRIDFAGTAQDAQTVWPLRERLCEAEVFDRPFVPFQRVLSAQGIKRNSGKSVDANVAQAPRLQLPQPGRDRQARGAQRREQAADESD